MPRYQVSGAWRDRPGDGSIEVVAMTAHDAEIQANEMGLLVSRVVQAGADQKISAPRVTLAIGAAIGAAATFLPWVRMPIMGTLDGTAGDGWFTFVGFLVVLAMALSPSPLVPLRLVRRAVAAVFATGCAALGGWKIVDLQGIRSDGMATGGMEGAMSAAMSVGVGLWLVVIAGVVCTVVAIGFRDRR